jgi:hypothetical protein
LNGLNGFSFRTKRLPVLRRVTDSGRSDSNEILFVDESLHRHVAQLEARIVGHAFADAL